MTYRMAIDTGGRSTDVVVADASGILAIRKALTDTERNFVGVQNAITDTAGQLGCDLRELLTQTDVFIYGTTRATNALVIQRTARTAMLLITGVLDMLVYSQDSKLHPHQINQVVAGHASRGWLGA